MVGYMHGLLSLKVYICIISYKIKFRQLLFYEMVQKRGRPREFDEERALTAAMNLFWTRGLSATSMDDLGEAMNMNRPSIYNAFGNKEAIYRRSLQLFCGQLDVGLRATLQSNADIETGLQKFYDTAIDLYTGGETNLGCLMMCTAPSEAINHPEVGADLRDLIERLDRAFEEVLEAAQTTRKIDIDVKQGAKLMQATLQSLALRARAGENRRSLRKFARFAVSSLFN